MMKNGSLVKVAGTTYMLTNERHKVWVDPVTKAPVFYRTFTYMRMSRRGRA